MRSKFILLLAVLMGMVTTLLFYHYTKSLNVENTAAAKTVGVVVAKEKINNNEIITTKNLEIVQMPEKEVLPQSINSFAEVDGKIATTVIDQGEPILSDHLTTAQDEGVYLSRKVQAGYRAVSVGVDFNQSVSNLIEPEDLVDIVYTDSQNPPQSKLLLEKVKVLAVGRTMLTPDQSKEQYTEYSSVTVELKPQDAVELINATQAGKIQFILYTRPEMDGNN